MYFNLFSEITVGGLPLKNRLTIVDKSKLEGYTLDLATAIKAKVDIPVVSAGRMESGSGAENALKTGQTGLIGLARVLWTDPEWPQQLRTGREADILHCDPDCGNACIQMVMKGRPAYCVPWPPYKVKAWKAKFA